MVTQPLAVIRKVYPEVGCKVFVDDMKFVLKGMIEELGRICPQLVRSVIAEFNKVGLAISVDTPGKEGKSKALATSKRLEAILQRPMKGQG
eukprot:11225584-Lingulodinium_polyedra.AAC.1